MKVALPTVEVPHDGTRTREWWRDHLQAALDREIMSAVATSSSSDEWLSRLQLATRRALLHLRRGDAHLAREALENVAGLCGLMAEKQPAGGRP